jgi:hypothetical protein
MYMDTSIKWRSFFETEVVVQTILSQFEIEKYKFIIIYPNLQRRTQPHNNGLEGPGRWAAEGWSSAPSANSDMEEGWICGFATTLGTAAILVYFISDGSEEG